MMPKSPQVPPGRTDEELTSMERLIVTTNIPLLRADAARKGDVTALILLAAQESAVRNGLLDLGSTLAYMATAALENPDELHQLIMIIDERAYTASMRLEEGLRDDLKRLGMEGMTTQEALEAMRRKAETTGVWPAMLDTHGKFTEDI